MTPYAEILRLARSGSREHAWERFTALGLDSARDDPDALTLKGRLLKDRARTQHDAQRAATFRAAGEAYAAAGRIAPASYPLINAATLALLAGSPDEARHHAETVLALIARDEDEPETPYWHSATRAEALLLLGRIEEARAALAEAVAKAPKAWEDHAATIGQFALILAAMGQPADWLDRQRPPPTLQFQGMMSLAPDDEEVTRAIRTAIEEIAPQFGYGALAAGADILIAEQLIARDAQLHVVLPCNQSTFRAQSVVLVDATWGPRFDACLEAAESVTTLGDGAASLASVRLCEEAAMGLALFNSRLLQSRAEALVVNDGGEVSAAAGTWRRFGNPLTSIVGKRAIEIATPPAWSSPTGMALAFFPKTGSLPADPHLWAEPVEDGTVVAYATPAQAARAALPPHAGVPVALDYGVSGDETSRHRLIDRTKALGMGVEQGVSASGPMAWALALHRPDLEIEPTGELRWSGGQVPTYRVSPPAS